MIGRIAWAPLASALLLIANGGVRAATPPACDVQDKLDTPEWHKKCDAAIAKERDLKKRAVLLFGRAYAAVEKYQYDDALVDLDAAVAADPDCARCRHERAYLNGELGNYTSAIADLDREIELTPESVTAYSERAFARSFSGDLIGAYKDRSRGLTLQPDDAGSLLARSEASLWLGEFDAAVADASQAQAFANDAKDEALRAKAAAQLEDIKLWRTTSTDKNPGANCVMKEMATGDAKTLIGDCTQAFLEAADAAAKAEALSVRATAWTVLVKSPENGTVDLRVAAGLDPKNSDRYTNLGFGYLRSNHSWAALREFDRAIAIKRSPYALAGRAAARLAQHDSAGAEADARESIDMEPNEAALRVLGDLAYDKGDKEFARTFYLWTYRMGSRDDLLIARLKELGVDDPAAAAAKLSEPKSP